MVRSILGTLAVVLAGTIASVTVSYGQSDNANVWDGVYAETQATRGQKLFSDQCATCHGAEMSGGPGAPGLVGAQFQFSWDKKRVGELFEYLRMSMPPGQAGTITDQEYADILAAVFKANGLPSGSGELPSVKTALDKITITQKKP